VTDYVALTVVSSFFTFLTGIFMYLIKVQFDKLNENIEELKQTFADNIVMLSEIENEQLMILKGIKHDQDSISEKIDRIRETQLSDSSLLHKR